MSFSTGQGELLTPNDCPSTIALTQGLLADVAEPNRHLTPLAWPFTTAKWRAISGRLSAGMTRPNGGA
jgi:hypothetical protein